MLSAMGVILLGRFSGFDEKTGRLVFAEDLMKNLRYGDEVSQKSETLIDEYIEKRGSELKRTRWRLLRQNCRILPFVL
jgi:putative flavoprotein involved in K+ transport